MGFLILVGICIVVALAFNTGKTKTTTNEAGETVTKVVTAGDAAAGGAKFGIGLFLVMLVLLIIVAA